MAPGTYGKTWWRGGYACGCMIQSIEDIIEPRLKAAGYRTPVNIFQYCYSGSVSASAGTHDGGGALDHAKGNDGETKIWRECGVADYQRGSPEDSAFDDHNHGIWQGCPHLSSGAANQVTDYKNGRNGLADGGPDQSPDVKPITWQDAYDKYSGTTTGVLGMSEMGKYDRSKDQTIKGDDEWHLLKIDDDDNLSLVTGPAEFIAYSGFTLQKVAAGAVAQLRYARVIDYPDSRDTTIAGWYPIHEAIGTSGDTFGEITFTNSIGSKQSDGGSQKIRLYAKAPSGADMIVASLTNRCFHS
jgi:hypothetical protein